LSGEIESSQMVDFVSINLHADAPFAGSEIDPQRRHLWQRVGALFNPVFRIAEEKLPFSESLSRRSLVQVCRIFVDA
jgi:hypothetical protein